MMSLYISIFLIKEVDNKKKFEDRKGRTTTDERMPKENSFTIPIYIKENYDRVLVKYNVFYNSSVPMYRYFFL
jgi:hypothetical protein